MSHFHIRLIMHEEIHTNNLYEGFNWRINMMRLMYSLGVCKKKMGGVYLGYCPPQIPLWYLDSVNIWVSHLFRVHYTPWGPLKLMENLSWGVFSGRGGGWDRGTKYAVQQLQPQVSTRLNQGVQIYGHPKIPPLFPVGGGNSKAAWGQNVPENFCCRKLSVSVCGWGFLQGHQ